MKDKTLYWILGIIAAYFVIRFVMNQIADKKSRTYVTKNDFGPSKCPYCGSEMKVYGRPGEISAVMTCSNPDCKTHSLDYISKQPV